MYKVELSYAIFRSVSMLARFGGPASRGKGISPLQLWKS
jgi:hypothetical protein